MVDQIDSIESHEPCVFISEFCNVIVFNGFNYFVIEGTGHGYIMFKDLVCFAVCIIGILVVRGCYNWEKKLLNTICHVQWVSLLELG